MTENGKVKVYDADGHQLTGITRISLYINTFGKVCAELSVKDVELDLEGIATIENTP